MAFQTGASYSAFAGYDSRIEGDAGCHFGGKATARKVLQAGLWWPTIFKDAKDYVKGCDVCQWVGKPSRRDELPLHLVRALQPFDKWAVYFIGPISRPAAIG